MEIKKFEEELLNLKDNLEINISVINVDDITNYEDTKVIINGKEIKDKVMFLICVEDK